MGASACRQTTPAPQQAFRWPQLPTEPHITAGPARSQPCQALKESSHSLSHDKARRCGVSIRAWVGLVHRLASVPKRVMHFCDNSILIDSPANDVFYGTSLKMVCSLKKDLCSWNKEAFSNFINVCVSHMDLHLIIQNYSENLCAL